MSLDHSPTRDGGGWSSPGLTTPYDEGSARSRGGSPGKKAYGDLMNGNSSHVTWAQAKAGSARVQRSNEGSFMRHMRKMSSGLPYFSDRSSYAEKEKLGRGRPWERVEWKDLPRRIGLLISRRRKYVALLVMMLLMILLFTNKTVNYWYRRTSWLGGGSKFVIILGANQGGGVMDWKGPREWAIERDSVKNKKKYAAEWGYEMEIADMSTKKRYAHEWRESWEKVDVIRNAMRKYPDAEWFVSDARLVCGSD
ncbi:alpha-1,6-mannosyltransferase [Extremus antarcticus]|uniref:Alpha-1,6-mannosyltransferase n=1 Tax=Extremus antarcticus TaxID=702011 RepID=A0AAJ0GK40_9PEZI|nr:alpha-1,6-mannosyltransferase [Extremus antarcticus]